MNPGMTVNPGAVPQMPLSNIYSDIYNTFLLINQALVVPGSYRFDQRKMSYMSYCSQIISTANQLALVSYVPVSANHGIDWLTEPGSLESEKISMISFQLQYYIANVGKWISE